MESIRRTLQQMLVYITPICTGRLINNTLFHSEICLQLTQLVLITITLPEHLNIPFEPLHALLYTENLFFNVLLTLDIDI